MSKKQGVRREPWRNQERHYCKFCNAWMGGDRQSILIHENGKKHKENAEGAMLSKRQERSKQEKDAKALQDSLKAIEAAALQSHSNDLGMFANHLPPPQPVALAPTSITSTAPTLAGTSLSTASKRQEKDDWKSKKKQREDDKRKKRGGDEDKKDNEEGQARQKKPRIALNEGHYTNDAKVYLEGVVFGDMLEEEMPVEIWTGNLLASAVEKRLPERIGQWRSGIAAAVRSKPSALDYEDRLVVDVAYLREPGDTEETLDKSVPLNRIRILLGSDEMIPNTLEEARIMAMGGEEIVGDTTQQEEIDEATGLSSWSTVSVKKTTVQQELKEERERLRQKRREATEEAEKAKRETERRKMEEAKVANADDSALGAYDVWSRSKEGYKGVDIHGEAKVQVHDFGKKLSDGKGSVGFKKSSFKAKKKQNRRTTSADDD